MAGLFQRLDTHMVDSHLMLSAMKLTSKIRRNYPAKWARDAANDPEYLGTLWRMCQMTERVYRGTPKRERRSQPQTPALFLSLRKPLTTSASPLRHRRGSPHR